MKSITHSAQQCRNRLLAMLPEDDYRSIAPHLELTPSVVRQVMFERDEPIEYIYFPVSAVHSALAFMENGTAVEVGTVGNEGFCTLDVLLGSEVAIETIVCQIPGDSLRMPVARFRQAVAGDTALRHLTLRYLQAYLSQISQSVACNRLHTTEERFARWVLMCHDRVPGDELQLTQEHLADMLGVHRPSVTLVARTFQQAGMIQYRRGTMIILDREAMEEACCECYGIVKANFKRLLNNGHR